MRVEPSRHVDVIEGNLPREVGPQRGSDYNTSQFIHRADSSAPEVTRTRVLPRSSKRTHERDIVNFCREPRVTRVYSRVVSCGTENAE